MLRGLVFLLFFVSGFCGLLYQIVWVRLAYTHFGVITPVLSVVISVFMLGLSIGSWLGGRWVDGLSRRLRTSPLTFYAIVEIAIGAGAFAVPALFGIGESVLLPAGDMDSANYLVWSAVILGFAILPFCICMGLTIPLMMAFLRTALRDATSSFSYLYLANVVGAMCGALTSALVLIELLGFGTTLLVAACLNGAVALIALGLAGAYSYRRMAERAEDEALEAAPAASSEPVATPGRWLGAGACVILFVTGFVSMGMEVVWVRAFTPTLGTATYSFASLVSVYLLATWIGSWIYRRQLAGGRVASAHRLLGYLAVAAFLPVVLNDARLEVVTQALSQVQIVLFPNAHLSAVPGVLFGIFPFCAILGYLTPMLIDRYSAGLPRRAGAAYAINILGCILGPLFASYWLLPELGARLALIGLALPCVALFLLSSRWSIFGSPLSLATAVCVAFAMFSAYSVNKLFEDKFDSLASVAEKFQVEHDYVATVTALRQGQNKALYVNGIGITTQAQVTKEMAHLPLVMCEAPEKSLVICFGMGTTYRSLLSWDIEATAVELVPGVRAVFGCFFDDAEQVLADPKGEIVIDDGRRYLKRSAEKFDVITIDPPPPIETAGSSLLYSREFYDLIKRHLKDGGVLAQWFPTGELESRQAVAQALKESFPHVRVYTSSIGWGFHFLASEHRIEVPTAEQALQRMPERARRDLSEWSEKSPLELLADMLGREVELERLLPSDPSIVITDDRPFNEYFFLRRLRDAIAGRQFEMSDLR